MEDYCDLCGKPKLYPEKPCPYCKSAEQESQKIKSKKFITNDIRIIFKNFIILLCLATLSFFIFNYTNKINTPEYTIHQYINHLQNGEYKKAYNFISSEDKAIQSISEFNVDSALRILPNDIYSVNLLITQIGRMHPLYIDKGIKKIISDKFSYKINSIKIIKKEAIADISYTQPNIKKILENDDDNNSSNFSKESFNVLVSEFCPIETKNIKLFLKKENKGYKIFLDWEVEKEILKNYKKAMDLKYNEKYQDSIEKLKYILTLFKKSYYYKNDKDKIESIKLDIQLCESYIKLENAKKELQRRINNLYW